MTFSTRYVSRSTALVALFAVSTACSANEASKRPVASAGSTAGGAEDGLGGGDAGSNAAGGRARGGSQSGTNTGKGGTTASLSTSEAGSGVSPVNLGAASQFVVLAKSGLSTVPPAIITGNIGVSPVAASYITGFSLNADATGRFSTSPQIIGKVYAADYATPTPSELTTAVGAMELAFSNAKGRAPTVTELGAGNIGGMTLAPGVYSWSSGLLIPTNVTLNGSATSVWILQIAQDLTVNSAVGVFLTGGALPKNVFWQVSGRVELGTTANFKGIVLSQTSINLGTGATVNGRLFAQTAVTLDASSVTEPAQ